VVLDFNLDGIPDVAISSPRTLSEHLWYQGKVEIFFGSKANNNPLSWTSSLRADVTILGDGWYANFGSTMITGDANGDRFPDLIIGSPFAQMMGSYQTGFVVIYDSLKSRSSGQLLLAGQADQFISAPNERGFGVYGYGWFGQSLLYVPAEYTHSSSPLLLVGAPGNAGGSSSTVMEAGTVSVFALDKPHRNKFPLAVIFGAHQNDRAGYKMSLGILPELDKLGPVLAFSVPIKNATTPFLLQTGEVVLVPLSKFLQVITEVKGYPFIPFTDFYSSIGVAIYGDQQFGRFGSSVEFANFVTAPGKPPVPTLFIGYPLWSSNTTEEGCVCAWESGPSFPRGVVNNPITSATKLYTSATTPGTYMTKDGRFGSNVAFGDLNGDRVTDVFIASERRSTYSILGGSVQIFFSNV